jgi:hypothetical protein
MKPTKANITKLLRKHGVQKSELVKGRICWKDSEGFFYSEFVYPGESIFLSYQESTFHHAPDFAKKRNRMLDLMTQVLTDAGFWVERDGDWVEIVLVEKAVA